MKAVLALAARLTLAAGLVLSAAPAALAQDEVIPFAPDDAAMEAALAEARATLPLFLAHALDDDGYGVEGAVVKVGFPAQGATDMSVEHIWVAPFARDADGGFVGLLANAPVDLGDLQQGDRVEFSEDMISDWHLTAPSGLYWGSYTSRVMHGAGAFGDTPFEQIFEAEPVPQDWR